MFKRIEKFITGLGYFNHMFIGLVIMVVCSIIPALLPFAATFVSAFYLGKEHRNYIYLGQLASFQINKWSKHDRKQTILVWIAVWLYVLGFNLGIVQW